MSTNIEALNWTINVELTIGDIKDGASNRRKFKNNKRKLEKSKNLPSGGSTKKTKTRHVRWIPGDDYVKIREASRVFQEGELLKLYSDNKLEEHMIVHFCHRDAYVCRTDKTRPKYVAVFQCKHADGTLYYIRTQHKYLKQMYRNDNRRDSSRAWDILPHDKTPYWTDRYADRIINEQESKRNYTKRQRALKTKKKK